MDGHVFHSIQGRRLTKANLWYLWRPVVTRWKAAGGRDLGLYELRHAAATMLLERGVSPADVAVQLGHTDGGALVMARSGTPLRTRRETDSRWPTPAIRPHPSAVAYAGRAQHERAHPVNAGRFALLQPVSPIAKTPVDTGVFVYVEGLGVPMGYQSAREIRGLPSGCARLRDDPALRSSASRSERSAARSRALISSTAIWK